MYIGEIGAPTNLSSDLHLSLSISNFLAGEINSKTTNQTNKNFILIICLADLITYISTSHII